MVTVRGYHKPGFFGSSIMKKMSCYSFWFFGKILPYLMVFQKVYSHTKGISTAKRPIFLAYLCSACVCTRKFNFGYPIPSLDKSSSSGTKEYWLYIYIIAVLFLQRLFWKLIIGYFPMKTSIWHTLSPWIPLHDS